MGRPWPSSPPCPGRGRTHRPEAALLSGCLSQTPGTLRPSAGLGPDSYFSLSTKGFEFHHTVLTHFFSFFTNMLMNENSVLPDLLPDLLPCPHHPAARAWWGSEARSDAAPGSWGCSDRCSEQHRTPCSEVSMKQGLYFWKPLLPWGSSKHNLGLITSFPISFPFPALLTVFVTGPLEALRHVGSPKPQQLKLF